MENYLKKVNKELSTFQNKEIGEQNNFSFPPLVDADKVSVLNSIYLNLFAYNRKEEPYYLSLQKIKESNIDDRLKDDYDFVDVISFKESQGILFRRSDILELIPQFDFQNITQESVNKISKLHQQKQLHGSAHFIKNLRTEGDLISFPIRNLNYYKQECVNFSQLKGVVPVKNTVGLPIEKREFELLLQKAGLNLHQYPVLKELVFYNIGIQLNKAVDLSSFKNIPTFKNISSLYNLCEKSNELSNILIKKLNLENKKEVRM